MALQTKALLCLLAGSIAGLLAWTLIVGYGLSTVPTGAPDDPAGLRGVWSGLAVGLLLGLTEALAADAVWQKWMALLLGSLGGVLGGTLGELLTPQVSAAMVRRADPPLAGELELWLALAWGLIGLVVGVGLGMARRSVSLAWQGGLGGCVGGVLGGLVAGGLVTDPSLAAEVTLPKTALLLRLLGLVAAGTLTGLGYGAMPLLLKPAWVRVMRNGRGLEEQILARRTVTIGQAETCDIVLRRDPGVAPVHALLETRPGPKRHRLRMVAGGSAGYPPILVNGRPLLGEHGLTGGDRVQIAGYVLAYYDNARPHTPEREPPEPQVWTQTAGAWQMTEMLSARPTRGAAVPPPPPDPQPSPIRQAIPDVASPIMPPVLQAPTVFPETPSGPRAGAVLRGESGPYVGRTFWLGQDAVVTIGRAADRQVALPMDTTVSRLHARILYENGQHVLTDAGAANGIFVNGHRLAAPQLLRVGDRIELGMTTFRYG